MGAKVTRARRAKRQPLTQSEFNRKTSRLINDFRSSLGWIHDGAKIDVRINSGDVQFSLSRKFGGGK